MIPLFKMGEKEKCQLRWTGNQWEDVTEEPGSGMMTWASAKISSDYTGYMTSRPIARTSPAASITSMQGRLHLSALLHRRPLPIASF